MTDIKERLSQLWLFALLNYLYADVVGLFALAGRTNAFQPLPPWVLMGSAILMEIPIAMILACRLLPFRVNRAANLVAALIVTLINGFATFVAPVLGLGKPPAFLEYLFFATIETVCTLIIIRQAWTWSEPMAASRSEQAVVHPTIGERSGLRDHNSSNPLRRSSILAAKIVSGQK